MKARIKETGETIEGFLDGHGHFDVPIDHCIFDRYNVEELEFEENGNPILQASRELVEAVEKYIQPKKGEFLSRNELLIVLRKVKKIIKNTNEI